MTPLKLDNYVRCVQFDEQEEWYAYSSEILAWFPLTAEKVAWIFEMTPAFEVETVLTWCRENCYIAAHRDSSGEFSFEKA